MNDWNSAYVNIGMKFCALQLVTSINIWKLESSYRIQLAHENLFAERTAMKCKSARINHILSVNFIIFPLASPELGACVVICVVFYWIYWVSLDRHGTFVPLECISSKSTMENKWIVLHQTAFRQKLRICFSWISSKRENYSVFFIFYKIQQTEMVKNRDTSIYLQDIIRFDVRKFDSKCFA